MTNKKFYPNNWEASIAIIQSIKTLQNFQQQPTVNISTAAFSIVANIPGTFNCLNGGIGKDTVKWLKTKMAKFEKTLCLEQQIVRNATFFGIVDCLNNINQAIQRIEKEIK